MQLAAATLVKRLHSPANRPASTLGMMALALCELGSAITLGWATKVMVDSVPLAMLVGWLTIFIVDLIYLTLLRKQSMKLAAKPAAHLMVTTAPLVTTIGWVVFMGIMIAAFWHGR